MPKSIDSCLMTDCDSPKDTRGYCNAHYTRVLRYGDPTVNKRVTHGQKGTKLYSVYRSMIGRCMNTSHQAYDNYGGRGITVCPLWLDFMAFFTWAHENGYTEGLSLDRIDNNKGYSPDNCRWATSKEQNSNTRANRRITIDTVTRTLMQWCELYNRNPSTVWWRMKRGWAEELAILTPADRHMKRKRG